jgi:hypothetical protein
VKFPLSIWVMLKGCSKHIDLYFFFLSDYISRGLVKFEIVNTKNQIPVIGTVLNP